MEKRLALDSIFRRSKFYPSWQRRHGNWSVLVCAGESIAVAPPIPLNLEAEIEGLKMRGWVGISFPSNLIPPALCTQPPKTAPPAGDQAFKHRNLLAVSNSRQTTGPRPFKRCQYHCMRVGFSLRLVISMLFSSRRTLTEMPRNDALPTVWKSLNPVKLARQVKLSQ